MKNIGSGSQKSNLFDYDESEDGATLADVVRKNESDTKNDFKIDDQFKQIIPPLQKHEYDFLEESIELRGVLEPIIVWKEENIIIDGHNRYEISLKLGKKKCPSKKISFSDRSEALLWIQKHQLERRNITDYTRYELVHGIREQLLEIGKEKRKRKPTHTESVLTENDKTKTDAHNTRSSIAGILGWGSTKVGNADRLFNEAPEEVKASLRNGSVTINSAHSSIIKITDKKKKRNSGEYAVIYVDNPADETFEQTLKLPLKETTAENAMLFIWCPVLVLDRLIKKLPTWGFHYRNMFVSEEPDNKTTETDGINSIQHELLIVAEKGKLEVEKPSRRSSVLSSEKKRSTKVLKMIENMFPSQLKAIFGDIKRDGWKNIGLNTSPVPEVTSVPASLIEDEAIDKSDGKKKLEVDLMNKDIKTIQPVVLKKSEREYLLRGMDNGFERYNKEPAFVKQYKQHRDEFYQHLLEEININMVTNKFNNYLPITQADRKFLRSQYIEEIEIAPNLQDRYHRQCYWRRPKPKIESDLEQKNLVDMEENGEFD